MNHLNIDDFIIISEVNNGYAFSEPLFQKKYRASVPDFPHHIVAFYRHNDKRFSPACYVHFTDAGEILLGGGACVDDNILRHMSLSERKALRVVGGLYQHTLNHAVRYFAPRYSAIFGYCGDIRAERADLAVGFVKTQHPHLLVYWTRHLSQDECERLIAKAHAVGPF